jgi:hypothetical protein
VAGALEYLLNSADHRFPAVAAMRYAVVTGDDGMHEVVEEGDRLDAVAEPDDVLDLVYRRVHQRAFELASLRGWVRLHAAVVDGPAGRTLLVASSGTGKTTLSCRLLLDGLSVPADESTLVRSGVALPVARRFHLKPNLEAAVPEVARLAEGLPSLDDGSIRAFDPGNAGMPWTIESAPVANVVLLERGSGPSSLDPASAIAVMPTIVSEAFKHQEPTGTLLAEIAGLLDRARCWHLVMGSVDDGASLVTSLPTGG